MACLKAFRACPQLSPTTIEAKRITPKNLKTFYHTVWQWRGAALSLAKKFSIKDDIYKECLS
nr:hypothetical protein [Holospora obtusa]